MLPGMLVGAQEHIQRDFVFPLEELFVWPGRDCIHTKVIKETFSNFTNAGV